MTDSNQEEISQKPNPSPELPDLCYRIAYFALPKVLFSQTQRTIGYFADPQYPVAPFVYVLCAKLLNVEPVGEYIPLFQTHSGELSETKNYHILEYPTPPPFELKKGASGVLAPFFSAIIVERGTENVTYYTLGQNPVSGTTLRMVTPDGANCNLGPGPVPKLDAFLQALRERT